MSRVGKTTLQARIDAALKEGEIAQALTLSEAAVQERPDDIGPACKHAVVLRRAGRNDDALLFLSALDQRLPDRLPILMAMAVTRRKSGQPDQAVALCDRVLDLQPGHVNALKMKVEIALARDDLSAALSAIQTGFLHDSPSTALVCRRASILRRMGRYTEALDSFDDLGKDQQSELPVRMERALILRGMGDITVAADLYASVLSEDPEQTVAWAYQIDIAVAAGKTDFALARAEDACQRFPDDALIASRHALALHKCGRSDEALASLRSLGGALRASTPAALIAGQILRDLGQHGEAAVFFEGVLENEPANSAASLALIDIPLQAGDIAKAVAQSEAAQERSPANAMLLVKHAMVLQRMGKSEQAREILTAHVEMYPQSLPALLSLASTLREAGEPDHAVALLDRLVEIRHPYKSAWHERIELAMQMADIDTALSLCAQATAHWPTDIRFGCQHVTALRQAGRLGEARARLDALIEDHPHSPSVLCASAEWHDAADETTEAEGLYQRVLALDPGHVQALRAIAAIDAARGDHGAVKALLSGDTGAGGKSQTGTLNPDRMSPGGLLNLLERLIEADETEAATETLLTLAGRAAALTDSQLARLMKFAERLNRLDIVAHAIRVAGERPKITLPIYLAFLRFALKTERADLAIDLETGLADRLHPAMRFRAEIEAAMLLHGPLTARERLRRRPRGSRLPQDASLFARVLLSCGSARLARRYLAFCLRRWPFDPDLQSKFVDACINSDVPEMALAWLDQKNARIASSAAKQLRLRVLLAANDRTAALDLLEEQVSAGRRPATADLHLRLLMSLGRLDAAETAARHLRSSATLSGERAAHFGISFQGALLNELRLYLAMRPADDASRPDADLVANNFHAARAFLDDWLQGASQQRPAAAQSDPATGPTCTIHQYWNHSQPPAEIADVMRSWQTLTGWRYSRLDRKAARRWLAQNFGIDYARAFALANHVAEESDFLRLCLLWHEGGVYADADDLRVGSVETLVGDGTRLVLFSEPFGALANNLIYAPPRHGAVAIAVRLAREALLRRDNDNVWLKTGPGLLTRAVAAWALQSPENAANDLDIRRETELYRSVKPHVSLPYKRKGSHWKRHTTELTDSEVIDALTSIIQSDSAVLLSGR